MGTLFRRGKTWCINYRNPDGKQVRRAISDYKETAERVLKKTEMDVIEGRYLDRKESTSVLFECFVGLIDARHGGVDFLDRIVNNL